jgi:hypothetical protein
VAISEAMREIGFIHYLFNDMGVKVEIPIMLRCDNVGATFMAGNSSSGMHSRQIDTSYHLFVNILKMGSSKLCAYV